MDHPDANLTPDRRGRLAQKGRRLSAKFCGDDGRGGCAEGFALHHIRRGEREVAADLLAFLEAQIEALKAHDPDGRLTITEGLAERIRRNLLLELKAESNATDPREPLEERGLVGPIGPAAVPAG